MREIKFSGKRVDNGNWVYGAYFCLHHNDERTHIHHFIIPNNVPIPKDKPIGEIQIEVIAETVGQFAELLDKNGKEIYEGYIVKSINKYNGRTTIGKVYFEDSTWFGAKDYLDYINKFCLIEVIGNIHDNPELLEIKE